MLLPDDYMEYFFSPDYLCEAYHERVASSPSRGIDGVSRDQFKKNHKAVINKASQKIQDGRFEFTRYKLKLISKGKGKAPREISVPTIRDKVVLRGLCDCLTYHFSFLSHGELPQKIIRDVKSDLQNESYDKFFKLDIKNFYPSIRHDYLIQFLSSCSVPREVVKLIEAAISMPTVSSEREDYSLNERGVPQGLSISNVLASIYLLEVDRVLGGIFGDSYYRYVDDILYLTKKKSVAPMMERAVKEFSELGLEVHEVDFSNGKSVYGRVGEDRFSYLGYVFDGKDVAVREQSLNKLRDSLAGIFVSYSKSKKKNQYLLQWRLNLRITGCLFENRFKGWLFFFSEINDLSVLYSLDSYIESLTERFSVTCDVKRFARAFFEVRFNRYSGGYVPDFDNLPIGEIKRVVGVCWGKDVSLMSDDELSLFFYKKLKNEVRDLDTDIGSVGYA